MNMDMYLLAIIVILVIGIFFVNSIETPSTEFQSKQSIGTHNYVTPNSQATAKVTIINSKAVATVTVVEE